MNKIASKREGYRTILGTQWPIETVVYRLGPRQWQVVWGLCNGVPSNAKTFPTRKAAWEFAGIVH